MDKKQVYDKMLEGFKDFAFPLVVLGVESDDAGKVTAFLSRWLPALESVMTPGEREQLDRDLNRACRVLARPFLRMVEKDRGSRLPVRRSSDD
jgi:hypothetical protein